MKYFIAMKSGILTFGFQCFLSSHLPDESNTSSVAISGRGVISATDKTGYSTAYPAENTSMYLRLNFLIHARPKEREIDKN